MKSEITKSKNGIEIKITDVNGLNGEKEKLLEAFQECSEGRCTCPTQEYEKVETLNIAGTDKTIQLSIKSKENTVINTEEIEKCLEYTKDKVAKKRVGFEGGIYFESAPCGGQVRERWDKMGESYCITRVL